MSEDVVLGIRLLADGSGLVGEVKVSQEELSRLGLAAEIAAAKAKSGFRDVPASIGLGTRAMGAFRAASEEASARLSGMVSGLGTAGRALAALGPVGLAVGVVFAGLVAVAGPLITSFAAAERASMRLEAQLKATGNATGLIRSEIQDLADEINDTSIFDDDMAKDAIASLSVFGKVHGQVFRDAIKVAADYAAATGRDLPAATEIIGRALQEPAEGLGALNRQLRLFDDEAERAIQRMVESGDAEKARIVILDALKGRFAGIASEMRNGVIGASGELKKALGNLAEDAGERLAKALNIAGLLQGMADAVNAARKAIAPTTDDARLTALEAKHAELKGRLAGDTSALTPAARAELIRSFAEVDKKLGELRAGIAQAQAATEAARRVQADKGKAADDAATISDAEAKVRALDPLIEQREKLAAAQAVLNKAIADGLDPLGKYKEALEEYGFRLDNLKDQVGQFLDAQRKSAELFDAPAGAARFRAQALQGVRGAGEGRGSAAVTAEETEALANAGKILAGQARDTAAALDIQSAGTLRLAEAQGRGGAAVREVEKALKVEAEVLKYGAANRALIVAAVNREFEARKQLAASTFDASMDRRIAAALALAEAELKGAAAVAEATLQNKIADQVQAEGAEGDKQRIEQIEARIRAEQRLIDLGSKRNELSRMRDELALAEKELELVGASVEVRPRELAIFAARQRLAQDGKVRTQEEIDAYVDLAAKIAEVRLQTDQAKEARDLWLEPFRNAIKGIQDAFAKAFESIFSGGVRSFGDLAKTVKSIMVQMAAQIAALMVFRPIVGNVLSSIGAPADLIKQLVPGFSSSGSSAGGGFGFGDIFSGLKNFFSPGDFLANAFPSLFGTTTVAGISLGGAALGVPGSALLGAGTGIPIAGELAALGAGAPLAGMAAFLPIAMAAIPLLISMFGKKPSVGPGGGVNLGWKNGAYDITSGEQDNGFNWRETAKPWGDQVAAAFKSILGDINATVLKGADLGVGFDAGKKKYYASYSRPDTGESERQWFDDVGEAAAAAVRFGLMKSDLSGVGPIVAKVLANSTAKSLEDLQEQLRFGESFDPTIEIWNAGIGSMTEQAIAFRDAAKAAAKAEAERIEGFLRQTDTLLNRRDATTTRSETRRLERYSGGGENDQGEYFQDTGEGGHSYTVVGGTTDRLRLLDHATGEFVDAIRDAATGLYTFQKTITEGGQASDTPSDEQVRAREAAKNRALSLIGLGPEVVKPLEGWSAAMAQAKAQIDAATPVLKAAGFTAEEAAAKIEEAWVKRLGDLRDDYTESQGRRLDAARGYGVLGGLEDLRTGLEKEHGDVGRVFSAGADQAAAARTANEIFGATVGQALAGLSLKGLEEVIARFAAATDAGSREITRQAQEAVATRRADGNRALGDQLAGASDATGAVAAAIQLQRAQQERARQAREDGLDPRTVARLDRAEGDRLLESWSADQLRAWRDYLASVGQLNADAVLRIDANLARIEGREQAASQAAERSARLGLDVARWNREIAASETALADARGVAVDLLNEQIAQTREQASTYRRLGDSLGSYSRSLLLDRNLSPLSQLQRLNEAERQFDDVAGRAQAGDVKAMEELQGISQSYLEASKDYFASSTDYYDDFQKVQAVLANTETIAQREARVQDQALQAAQAQLAQVTGINQNTQTIAQAMEAWRAAQTAAGTARTTVTGQQWTAFQRLAEDYQRDYYAETTSDGRRQVTERYGQMRDTLLNAIQDVDLLQRIGQTYYTGNTSDPGAVLLRSLIFAKGKIPAFAMGGVAEGWFTAGERGPELLYAGSPTRVFDHDTSKRIAAGNDNASAERVVVAIDRGTARMVDELMAMHRTMDTRLGQVVSAVGAQGQALTKLGDAIRVLAARAA